MLVKLQLNVPGASEAQIMAGLQAAAASFRRSGVNPIDAADGRFAREGIDIGADVEYDDEVGAIAWDKAEHAAFAAVVGKEGTVPAGSFFGIVPPEGERRQPLSLEQEFHLFEGLPMDTAPKDGSYFLAKDVSGVVTFITWRIHPDMSAEDDDPHWARGDTGELFEPTSWVDINVEERVAA